MPCCTCCCVKLDGECCGPDGNKVCCKDPDSRINKSLRAWNC
jgi:hypothetical protein